MDPVSSHISYLELDIDQRIWSSFYMVSPLIVVGTREGRGYNFAPKHMAMPLGFGPYYGFICTPRHQTYHNIIETRYFTVSFPVPDQIIMTSLAALPRCESPAGKQQLIDQLPTFPAATMDALCLEGAYLCLECELDRIVEGFEDYALICGKIRRAIVHPDYHKTPDLDPLDQLYAHPLMAYLPEERYAEVRHTLSFPFPKDFQR